MGAHKASCANDEDGHAALTVDLGRGADLLLPLDPTPRGREIAAPAEINEALEAEI